MIKIMHNGASRLAVKMQRAAKIDLHRALVNSTERSARVVEKDLKDRRFAGDPINMRSGLTRSSIRTAVDRGKNPGAAVGTPMKHVPGLEVGITITPTHAKVLAVPLPAALTPSGKSRGGPRSYPGGFWMKRKGWRNPIFFQKRGANLVALFVGLKRVRIKARHPFEKSVKATSTGVVKLYDQGVGQAIR